MELLVVERGLGLHHTDRSSDRIVEVDQAQGTHSARPFRADGSAACKDGEREHSESFVGGHLVDDVVGDGADHIVANERRRLRRHPHLDLARRPRGEVGLPQSDGRHAHRGTGVSERRPHRVVVVVEARLGERCADPPYRPLSVRCRRRSSQFEFLSAEQVHQLTRAARVGDEFQYRTAHSADGVAPTRARVMAS